MKKRNTTYRLNKVDYSIFIICSLAAAFTLYLFYRDLNSYTIKGYRVLAMAAKGLKMDFHQSQSISREDVEKNIHSITARRK